MSRKNALHAGGLSVKGAKPFSSSGKTSGQEHEGLSKAFTVENTC